MSHSHPLYAKRLHLIARRRWTLAAYRLRKAGNLPAAIGAWQLAQGHARASHNLTA